MCSLSSYKQRERRECGYSRRFYRLNVYTTNLYPPTGNLDSETSGQVMELLQRTLKDLGQTMVMITHNEAVAAEADRILHIKDGKLIKE